MIKLLLKELDLILWVYITRSVFKDEHSTEKVRNSQERSVKNYHSHFRTSYQLLLKAF